MTEPLDFTAAGRKRNAPQPPPTADHPPVQRKSPKRSKVGTPTPTKPPPGTVPSERTQGSARTIRIRIVLVLASVFVIAAIGGFVLLARGRNSGPSTMALNRYCVLATQLQDLSLGSHAASAPGKFDGSPNDFQRLIKLVGTTTFADLENTAPSQISGDVKSIDLGLRDAASGSRTALESSAFARSVLKTEMYRAQHCPSGATSVNNGS
jgi:hypothetical protein